MPFRRSLRCLRCLFFLSLLSLPGCEEKKSALVSGKFLYSGHKHPKVGLVLAEGNDQSAMLKDLQGKLDLITREGTLTFGAVVLPEKDGAYSVELESARKNAGFTLYAWNDANGNDRIDKAEGFSLAKSSRNDSKVYSFLKTGRDIRYSDSKRDTVEPIRGTYDFEIP
ncbi:MAG TPA: hypothetical protein DD435_13225 [Cyanobacteria bacterium UBA8530]|nr:hypothetical protein [Cyanobacteria bacterium UBA8530]